MLSIASVSGARNLKYFCLLRGGNVVFLFWLKVFSKVSCKFRMAAVGFDASSADSCVDVWKNVGVETIVIDQGSRKTPTCVVFTNIERLIGKARKNRQREIRRVPWSKQSSSSNASLPTQRSG